MSASAQRWLATRAWPAGTLACALHGPDGNVICHRVDERCPPGAAEKVLGYFDTLAAAISAEPQAPHWSTWAFEQGHIRLVERPDGWRLALVVCADSDAAHALDSVSQEFLAIQFEN